MKHIKKIMPLLIGIALIWTSQAIAVDNITLLSLDEPQCQITKNYESCDMTITKTIATTQIAFTLKEYDFETIQIVKTIYKKPILRDEAPSLEDGMPDLPRICRSIIIPENAKTHASIKSSTYHLIENINIIPSKGIKEQDNEQSSYEFNQIYTKDLWYPESIVSLNKPYILRDFTGQVVQITPFQYNPVQQKLRVYTSIQLEINAETYEKESDETIIVNQIFDAVYRNQFLNYNLMSSNIDVTDTIGDMLVITYDQFYDTIHPFIEWKNQMGIPTEVLNVSSNKETPQPAEIKTWIAEYYSLHDLTYVLFVGDHEQVPTFELTFYNEESDPVYAYLAGEDSYPEIFVGRFSAETIAEVETQVERSIEYEKYPQEEAEWYEKGIGIASTDNNGDLPDDWEYMEMIRDRLLRRGFTIVDQLYDQQPDIHPSYVSDTEITNALNDGRSIVNYAGHGENSGSYWITGGYGELSINELENGNMLPFIWSVACQVGSIKDHVYVDACPGEAFLRATHNGEPTGAIAVFMSSADMHGPAGLTAQQQTNFYLHDLPDSSLRFAVLSFLGCIYANDIYGEPAFENTDFYHVFGDPSLQLRTDKPGEILAFHDDEIKYWKNSFPVHAIRRVDYNPTNENMKNGPSPSPFYRTSHILCSLSKNGEYLGSALTDYEGDAVIELTGTLTQGEIIDLVITGYNGIPYINTINVT